MSSSSERLDAALVKRLVEACVNGVNGQMAEQQVSLGSGDCVAFQGLVDPGDGGGQCLDLVGLEVRLDKVEKLLDLKASPEVGDNSFVALRVPS